MSAILKLVGQRIRYLRKEKNLTQEKLAEKSGLHYSYIGGVERGTRNISLETIEKITDALDILPVELFRFEDADAEQAHANKKYVLSALNSLMIERSIDEIKLIYRLAQDIFTMMDQQKS